MLPTMAQISANGYYRVKNFITDRYIIVVDSIKSEAKKEWVNLCAWHY